MEARPRFEPAKGKVPVLPLRTTPWRRIGEVEVISEVLNIILQSNKANIISIINILVVYVNIIALIYFSWWLSCL